jgi:hypothetical protein
LLPLLSKERAGVRSTRVLKRSPFLLTAAVEDPCKNCAEFPQCRLIGAV